MKVDDLLEFENIYYNEFVQEKERTEKEKQDFIKFLIDGREAKDKQYGKR